MNEIMSFQESLREFQESLLEVMDIKEYKNIEQFAKAIGINRNAIDRWMSGTSYPHLGSVIKIADFFCCSTDYLFGLKSSSEYKPSGNRSKFLDRFISLAEANGLTDYKIAKACGCEPSVIAKWRHHGQIPQIPKLIKLTKILNCSLDYLVGLSDNL